MIRSEREASSRATATRGQLALALALSALALTLSTPAPAHAAFPGLNGRLAFARAPSNGDPRIYAMNANGSAQTALTSGVDEHPAWSPDGAGIAFDKRPDKRSSLDIYKMKADGSGQTRLTTDSGQDYDPAWSPDGSKIAFISNRNGRADVFVMKSDGSGETALTANTSDSDSGPSWSPDGHTIAFSRNLDGNGEIYVMNADGSAETRLPGGSTDFDEIEPDWSPDGGRIVYTQALDTSANSNIFVMNADGSGRTALTTDPALDQAPAWSPDGTRIAFASQRTNVADIYVMHADGSAETPLTTTADADSEPSWQPLPPAVSIGNARIAEGDSGLTNVTLGVSLSRPLFAPVRVSFATAASRARAPLDYVAQKGLINFAPGVTRTTVAVQVVGDPIDEPNESFLVKLSNPAGAALGDATGRVTIVDDDPPPVLGKSFDLEPLAGKVLISLPRRTAHASASVPGLKGRSFKPLTQSRRLPMGSILDTRHGRVRITTSTNRRGKLQSGQFASGVFQVLQSRARRAKGLTELRLKGASFKSCTARKKKRTRRSSATGAPARAARRLSRRHIRRLSASAKGRFRTRGRHSAATVRGTIWSVTDRCDGTLTSVKRGKVAVRDFRRRRTILLRKGKSYLARAPG